MQNIPELFIIAARSSFLQSWEQFTFLNKFTNLNKIWWIICRVRKNLKWIMHFFNYMQSQRNIKKNGSTTKLSLYLRVNVVPSDWRHYEYILVHKAQDQNTFLLLCKLVPITLLQYSEVCAHAACQTTPNSFQLWMAVSMCLRLIAGLLLSVLLYGFESQQSNGNIAKQKRSQTVTWLEIPKAPSDLPIKFVCCHGDVGCKRSGAKEEVD